MNVADNIAYGLRARRAGGPPRADPRRALGAARSGAAAGLERRFPTSSPAASVSASRWHGLWRSSPASSCSTSRSAPSTPRCARTCARWLREIHERTGQTTVFVTHDQDEALELADRVAVLNQGSWSRSEPPTMFRIGLHPFVMNFLGEAARFDAEIRDGRVLVNGKLVPVAAPKSTIGQANLYCRPWHLKPVHAGHGHHQGLITGVRRLGSMRRIEVTQADGSTRDRGSSRGKPEGW